MRTAIRHLGVLGLAIIAALGSASAAVACPAHVGVTSYVGYDDGPTLLRDNSTARVTSVLAARVASHSHGPGHHHQHDRGGAPHEHCPCHAPLGGGATALVPSGQDLGFPDSRRESQRADDDAVLEIRLSFLLLRPPSLAA